MGRHRQEQTWTTSAGTILPPEFYAPDHKELPMAQLDFGPRSVIF
jgi:hypothetical protein